MKYAAPVRREIGARTIFNILGPLSNPAFAALMLLGVYDGALLLPAGQGAFKPRRPPRSFVVHGDDGLDEASLTATTSVCQVFDGELTAVYVRPA